MLKKIKVFHKEPETAAITALRSVDESSKEELLWLLSELQRLGIRSVGDLENQIANIR